MNSDDRHQSMDAARVRAELSVRDLWLSYVAIGGSGDVFDLDGYLQGLVPLEAFQQDVLAQCLNESLEDSYRSYRIPLSMAPPDDAGDDRLRRLIDELLEKQTSASENELEPPIADPG
jgi:hypothetical protein